MRKVVCTMSIDTDTFAPILQVKMIPSEGMPAEVLLKEPMKAIKPDPMIYRNKEYSVEEYEKIELCNKALIDNNYSELTTEEADFMLSRSDIMKALSNYTNAAIPPNELQALAGFEVKKIITSLQGE